MSLCAETESIVIDSIDQSIREVFSMMAGTTLRRSEICGVADRVRNADTYDPELTVVMGITGELTGTLSLTMQQSGAIRWTQALIETSPSEIDQEVVDAVGELGNMVVGGAKRRLADFHLTMSLPSVIRAGIEKISFSSNTAPLVVSYDFEGNCITVMIVLSGQAAHAD